jgi:hypothetical protein
MVVGLYDGNATAWCLVALSLSDGQTISYGLERMVDS